MPKEICHKKLEERVSSELASPKIEPKTQILINVGKKRGARYVLTEESQYRRV